MTMIQNPTARKSVFFENLDELTTIAALAFIFYHI
jgi:hypothetical protein